MKKFFSAIIISTGLFSCKDNTPPTTTAATPVADTAAPAANVDYAYKVPYYANWRTGNTANTQNAMKALKAFEQGNIDETMNYFADTIMLELDHLDVKAPKDSIATLMKQGRAAYKAIEVKMDDFESVISQDGKVEYVSLWYKQYWTDKSGKKDSIDCFNDFRMVKGKIASLTELIRHFGHKKM